MSDAVCSILQTDLKVTFRENKDFIIYPRSVYKSGREDEIDLNEELVTRL